MEYPDIESLCKKIGAPPTEKKLAIDGSGRMVDHYTLPVIHDSTTGRVIADSFPIVEYLEDTYPETPSLFPPGSRAAISLFNDFVNAKFVPPLCLLILPTVYLRLNKHSQCYFRITREYWYGLRLEEFSPPDSLQRNDAWLQVKQGLKILSEFYEKNQSGGDYFIGNSLTYADIIIGSFLHFPKLVLFPRDFNWEYIAKLDGGRWGRIADEMEKYRQVL